MARDPKKRAASREMDRIRKQTRRAIERYGKIAESTENMRERHAALQRMTALQSQLAQTYAGKISKTYSEQARKAARSLRAEKTETLKELRETGYSFRKELSRAASGKISALGARGQLKAKAFYRATQNIWQGLPNSEREQAIKDALGVDSLEAAYNKVMNTPEMRAALRGAAENVVDTESVSAAYMQAERTPKGDAGSPDALLAVQVIEFAKAYA